MEMEIFFCLFSLFFLSPTFLAFDNAIKANEKGEATQFERWATDKKEAEKAPNQNEDEVISRNYQRTNELDNDGSDEEVISDRQINEMPSDDGRGTIVDVDIVKGRKGLWMRHNENLEDEVRHGDRAMAFPWTMPWPALSLVPKRRRRIGTTDGRQTKKRVINKNEKMAKPSVPTIFPDSGGIDLNVQSDFVEKGGDDTTTAEAQTKTKTMPEQEEERKKKEEEEKKKQEGEEKIREEGERKEEKQREKEEGEENTERKRKKEEEMDEEGERKKKEEGGVEKIREERERKEDEEEKRKREEKEEKEGKKTQEGEEKITEEGERKEEKQREKEEEKRKREEKEEKEGKKKQEGEEKQEEKQNRTSESSSIQQKKGTRDFWANALRTLLIEFRKMHPELIRSGGGKAKKRTTEQNSTKSNTTTAQEEAGEETRKRREKKSDGWRGTDNRTEGEK